MPGASRKQSPLSRGIASAMPSRRESRDFLLTRTATRSRFDTGNPVTGEQMLLLCRHLGLRQVRPPLKRGRRCRSAAHGTGCCVCDRRAHAGPVETDENSPSRRHNSQRLTPTIQPRRQSADGTIASRKATLFRFCSQYARFTETSLPKIDAKLFHARSKGSMAAHPTSPRHLPHLRSVPSSSPSLPKRAPFRRLSA